MKRYWKRTHRKEIFLEKKEEEQNRIVLCERSRKVPQSERNSLSRNQPGIQRQKKLANPP